MSVHFSSLKMDWKTPKAVYQILDAEFHFDHDPCPPNFTVDGLTSEWGQVNYVNPPYGKEQPKWIQKGYEESLKGKTSVFLIPSRTDTKAWHDYCMKADEIRFIRGRLYFGDGPGRAPFPSAIIIFKGEQS
jgi:hypothetical protein